MEHQWCFTAFERPPGTLNECARPKPVGGERQVSANPISMSVFLPEDFW